MCQTKVFIEQGFQPLHLVNICWLDLSGFRVFDFLISHDDGNLFLFCINSWLIYGFSSDHVYIPLKIFVHQVLLFRYLYIFNKYSTSLKQPRHSHFIPFVVSLNDYVFLRMNHKYGCYILKVDFIRKLYYLNILIFEAKFVLHTYRSPKFAAVAEYGRIFHFSCTFSHRFLLIGFC